MSMEGSPIGLGKKKAEAFESDSGLVSYHCRCRKGYIPVGPETGFKPKENQDSHVEVANFMNVPDLFFIGVYDGHGMNGRRASQFVKSKIVENL